MTTAKVLDGLTFGRLTVLHREPKRWSKRAFWRCLCECGTECVKMGKYLLNGNTSSCGCAQREMRERGNPKYGDVAAKHLHKREYSIWRSMKSRCQTASSSNYRFYGGRGIRVCERWSDFNAFYADMGDCPPGLTIDRIDSNGHYEPGNCRWASVTEQQRNTRRNLYIEFRGATVAVSEAFAALGVPEAKRPDAYRMLRRGRPLQDVADHYATARSRSS